MQGNSTAEELAEVAARIRAEGPLPVVKAAALVPAACGEGTVNASVLVRWITKGKRGVRLDGTLIAGKGWWTSAAALDRFFGALAAAELRQWEAPRGETPAGRDRRAEAAEREADELFGA